MESSKLLLLLLLPFPLELSNGILVPLKMEGRYVRKKEKQSGLSRCRASEITHRPDVTVLYLRKELSQFHTGVSGTEGLIHVVIIVADKSTLLHNLLYLFSMSPATTVP